jgi:hypothetical protein
MAPTLARTVIPASAVTVVGARLRDDPANRKKSRPAFDRSRVSAAPFDYYGPIAHAAISQPPPPTNMKAIPFFRACYGAVLLLSTTASVFADKASDLFITHQGGKPDEIYVKHKEQTGRYYKLGDKIKLKARQDEQVNIFITDANPLVFTYKLGEQTKTPTADYEALKKLAGALKQIFSQKTAETSGAPLVVPPKLTKLTLNGAEISPVSLEADITALATEVGKIDHTIEASLSGPPTGRDVFDITVVTEKVTSLKDSVKFFQALEEAQLAPNRETIKAEFENQPAATFISPLELAKTHRDIQMIFEARAKLATLLEQTQSFIKDLKNYQQASAKPFRIGSVNGDNANDISQPVIIGGTTDGAAIPAVKSFQELHDGVYDFVFSPEQSFHYRISGGVIYSFVRNPEYSVATDAAGKVTIAEKSSDYNEVSGALALNVYPDRLFDEGVKWFGQIGVSPAKDANAFLLGAGFDAFDKLSLGAGIIYQQRRELAGGQTVGMPLAKAEDLNVNHRFHTGFYILFGVSF